MTRIKVELDETAKNVDIFKTVDYIEINKQELFKFAIMSWEVPEHIKEADYFDHIQSKIPGIEMKISDFIEMTETGIKNLSKDDRNKKDVSESIGVGLGLKYSSMLLKANLNMFKKIPPVSEGKYLDYSVIVDQKEYEIETKGTVSKYYQTQKDDIIKKKANKANRKVHLKYGTIAMISNENDESNCRFIVVDDPPNDILTDEYEVFKTQISNYSLLLSYILDTKYYNKFIKPILRNKLEKAKINSTKFFGKYHFNGKDYLGEYFDYRLYKEDYEKHLNLENRNKNLFKYLTKEVGKTKIFIGLEIEVIKRLNSKDFEFFKTYSSKVEYIRGPKVIRLLDIDGILIVKSLDGQDQQIENIFSETIVEERLNLYDNYFNRVRHLCGAPCTSRAIEGKPCEKKTYREHCHFHR